MGGEGGTSKRGGMAAGGGGGWAGGKRISRVRMSGKRGRGCSPMTWQKIGGVAQRLANEETVREQSSPLHQSWQKAPLSKERRSAWVLSQSRAMASWTCELTKEMMCWGVMVSIGALAERNCQMAPKVETRRKVHSLSMEGEGRGPGQAEMSSARSRVGERGRRIPVSRCQVVSIQSMTRAELGHSKKEWVRVSTVWICKQPSASQKGEAIASSDGACPK